MAENKGRPEVAEAKLKDFPTEAVAEYFESQNLGIHKKY